jgi:hypothetical protein
MLKELLMEIAKLGVPQEQIDKINAACEEEMTKALEGYVPKIKLEEAETEKSQLLATIKERDGQLAALQASAGDSEEIATLRTELAAAIAKNETDKTTAAAEMSAYKKDNAVNMALAQAGAKNPKAVKALLDLEKMSLDGDNLIGFADQLEGLKTSDPYLFENTPNLLGREPGAGSGGYSPGGESKDNPFKKETWNLTKQGELLAKDPELYKKMAAAAGIRM